MGGSGNSRKKRNRAELLSSNLPQLQNLIRRDPQSYKQEFTTQWQHWESIKQLLILKPQDNHSSTNLSELVNFLAHVTYCFPKEPANAYPDQLIDILSTHHQVLDTDVRRSLVQALILLRNRNLVQTTSLLSLFFTLFRVHDKELRKLLHSHIVTDIKNSNAKTKDNKLNKTLQNFMYTMLQDSEPIAARKSLDVMIDLYHKNIWNDAKTVNVIAEALFSNQAKLVSTAIHFFLGTNDPKKKDGDDDEDGVPDLAAIKHQMQINKKKGSKQTMLDKAKASIKRKETKKSRAESFNFSALHLLNDPQGLAEKLLSRLRTPSSSTLAFTFALRLEAIDLTSRLIGVHKLLVLGFYDYLTPYLRPTQREVARLLACAAQASHDLVPPDVMQPLVQAVADRFVWSNAAGEVIAAGV